MAFDGLKRSDNAIRPITIGTHKLEKKAEEKKPPAIITQIGKNALSVSNIERKSLIDSHRKSTDLSKTDSSKTGDVGKTLKENLNKLKGKVTGILFSKKEENLEKLEQEVKELSENRLVLKSRLSGVEEMDLSKTSKDLMKKDISRAIKKIEEKIPKLNKKIDKIKEEGEKPIKEKENEQKEFEEFIKKDLQEMAEAKKFAESIKRMATSELDELTKEHEESKDLDALVRLKGKIQDVRKQVTEGSPEQQAIDKLLSLMSLKIYDMVFPPEQKK